MTGAGRYRYWLDGRLQDIDETSSWSPAPGGVRLRGRRSAAGQPVFEIDALFTGSDCTELSVTWLGGPGPRVAHYRIDGRRLLWRVDGRIQSLDLPDGCRLFALLRAATGPLLRTLIDAPRPVLVPRLHDPQAPDFLAPLLSTRQALRMPTIDGNSQHLRYVGGEYGESGCDCWLAPVGRLLRYRWDTPQGRWDVRWDADGDGDDADSDARANGAAQ